MEPTEGTLKTRTKAPLRRRRCCPTAIALRRHRHQEVAADADAQVVDAVEEFGEIGVQPGGQDLVDAAVLQVRAQPSGTTLGFAALFVGHPLQVADHLVEAGRQRARHVGAQDQQFGHLLGAGATRTPSNFAAFAGPSNASARSWAW